MFRPMSMKLYQSLASRLKKNIVIRGYTANKKTNSRPWTDQPPFSYNLNLKVEFCKYNGGCKDVLKYACIILEREM